MNIRLEFVTETEKAILYRDKNRQEFWIPRSAIHRRLKFPTKTLDEPIIHEVDVNDWWAEQKGLK